MSATVQGTSFGASSLAASYGKWRSLVFFPNANPETDPSPAISPASSEAAGMVAATERNPAAIDLRKEEAGREAALDQALANTNDWLASNNRSLRFRFHQDLGRVQVQVMDSQKNQVIRSVPSDEILHFHRRMRELAGLGAMVDESR